MKDDNWNFGEGDFPSIEIDLDYLKTLSNKDKFRYIAKLFFQEKELGNRINLLNYVIGTASRVGRVFIKNKEFKEYLNLLENGTKLIGVSAALGNMFKAKQTFKHTKNNEIARLMGFPSGNYISSTKMDVTPSMLEAFMDMSDFHKDKYKLKIDNTVSDEKEAKDPGKKADDGYIGMKKIMLSGSLKEETNKWGLIVNTPSAMFEGESESTDVANAQLFYPISGSTIHYDDLKEQLQSIMFNLYIEKVDTRKNYVRINGTKLEICERENITENIRNIDITKITYSIQKTLQEKSRRGIVFVGEPGVGKTISVHKLINNFRSNLVFWVNPDSVSTVAGIRNVFKIFKMFKSSIIVFDDIDSVTSLTGKNEVSNEFLVQLDGTSTLTGFVIATVNDPSKLHPALINRPERFDEAIEVLTPQTYEEVTEILYTKAVSRGYVTQEDSDEGNYESEVVGLIKINLTGKAPAPVKLKKKSKKSATTEIAPSTEEVNDESEQLNGLLIEIIKAKLTQVQIAGIIGHCHNYYGVISLESLRDGFERTVKSMECSNLVAKKGRLVKDDGISEEAKSNLSTPRSRF